MRIPLIADYFDQAGLVVARAGTTICIDLIDMDNARLTVQQSKELRDALEKAELDAAIYRVHGSAGCPSDARPDAPAVVEKEGP